MQVWIVGLAVVLNLFTFGLMAHDKSRARKKGRRVPERTFFLLAALGGSIGAIIGMRTWRHKTKHASFVIGMPVIFLLQIALISYWTLVR